MVGMEWILKVKDKEYYMDSCVEHFMLLLKAAITQVAGFAMESASVHDTGNNAVTVGAFFAVAGYNWNGGAQPAAGNDNFGIQVGSDDTAVDILDYKLGTKIAHGVGGGQLQYGLQTTAYGGVAPNKHAKLMRTFTNNSGGDVTVKEVGLVVGPYTSGSVQKYILITHDIIPAPVVIANLDTMPVEIYIRTTA